MTAAPAGGTRRWPVRVRKGGGGLFGTSVTNENDVALFRTAEWVLL